MERERERERERTELRSERISCRKRRRRERKWVSRERKESLRIIKKASERNEHTVSLWLRGVCEELKTERKQKKWKKKLKK